MGTDFINIIKTIHFVSLLWILLLPAAMMGIDIITGLTNAWSKKDFQSAKMRTGLAKKVGELAVILTGILFTYGMGLPDYILMCVSLYIILMELMSVFENLDKLGVPVPKVVKNVINNVGHSLQDDNYEELMKKMKSLEKMIETSNAIKTAIEVEQETRIQDNNNLQEDAQ